MSGKSSEMVDGVVECPIIRKKKDLHFDWSFYKIPLISFAKGGTLNDLMHLSKAETSHAGVLTFPPFKKEGPGGF
ncbi:MAG: hypothetical protein WBM78_09225 [Desulfobacterales bacterium]